MIPAPGWYLVGSSSQVDEIKGKRWLVMLQLPGHARGRSEAMQAARAYINRHKVNDRTLDETFLVWLDNKNKVPFATGAFRIKRAR